MPPASLHRHAGVSPFRWLSIAAALALTSRLGTAQTPSPASDERSSLRLGSNSDVTLTLGGYLQVDGRILSSTVPSPSDGLLLRRARLVFDAQMASGWHMRLQPDFGQGRVLIQDAYVGYEQRQGLLRIGRFRPAFGVERSQSSASLLHGERSIANTLMPSRSFGAQGSLRRGALAFTLGAFRTPIGATPQSIDTDGDVEAVSGSGYDGLARVLWAPRRGARYLDVQLAMLAGSERGELTTTGVARLLSIGQQPLLAFRNDGTAAGTVIADGSRARTMFGAIVGDAHVVTAVEAALFTQRVRLDTRREVTAGTITWRGAYVLGGTRRPTQEIVPSGKRGALEIGLRAGTLGVWGDELSTVIMRRSLTRALTGGAAIGWVPTVLTRLSLGYDITHDPRGREIREHVLLLRVQQGF